MTNLLPGMGFTDPTKFQFHKGHTLDYRHGIPEFRSVKGIGGDPKVVDSVQYNNIYNVTPALDHVMTYGRPKSKAVPAFRPHYVKYDKKCLRFHGYFKQDALNSPNESFRIRVVELLYFLDDDTVSLIEPQINNSGLPQGRLVRRSRVPQGPPPDCEYLHWKSLNVGQTVRVCGFAVVLVDCDPFTRQFLTSQGIEVGEPGEIPKDSYAEKQTSSDYVLPESRKKPEAQSLRQRLLYDGVTLRFEGSSDEDGELSHYCVSYFPVDQTIQVSEIHNKNNGKDPFPIFLRRTKLPKNWRRLGVSTSCLNEESSDESDFYKAEDLLVGQNVDVYGRTIRLHKCNDFTRRFYESHLHIEQPANLEMEVTAKKTPAPPPRVFPPYTGFGSLEDSLQSCLSFNMKSPRRDIVKRIVNANKYLRYEAKLQSSHAEDADRKFVLSYSLADGTIEISEPPMRNSGHIGGRFLARTRVPKPGTSTENPDYYSPNDFAIGAVVIVNEFRFEITGADAHVYSYMVENAEKFRPEVIESVKSYLDIPT